MEVLIKTAARQPILLLLLVALYFLPVIACAQENLIPRHPPESPFGINIHLLDCGSSEWGLVEYLGVDWVRVDFNWADIEVQDNQYIWNLTESNYYDCTAQTANKLGLNVFATISKTPSWLGESNSVPEVHAWMEFVRHVVERYDGDGYADAPGSPVIRYWGMWNEPDNTAFFTGTLEQYREIILKPGYRAAKSADPTCKVVGLAAAEYLYLGWNWEPIFDDGGINALDIISTHEYYYDGDPLYEVLNVLGILDDLNPYGIQKEIWITETGSYTYGGSRKVSEAEQAKKLREMCHHLMCFYNVSKVFFYELKDLPNSAGWGLFNMNNTPKQAAIAYREIIERYKCKQGGDVTLP